jgi:hypothetical protein
MKKRHFLKLFSASAVAVLVSSGVGRTKEALNSSTEKEPTYEPGPWLKSCGILNQQEPRA